MAFCIRLKGMWPSPTPASIRVTQPTSSARPMPTELLSSKVFVKFTTSMRISRTETFFLFFFLNSLQIERTIIKDGPEDYEVAAGQTATFRCNAVADSSLNLTIDWLHADQLIDFEQEPRFVQSQDQSLTITKTTELDTGDYTCRAKTILDSAEDKATLIVQGKLLLIDFDCFATEASDDPQFPCPQTFPTGPEWSASSAITAMQLSNGLLRAIIELQSWRTRSNSTRVSHPTAGKFLSRTCRPRKRGSKSKWALGLITRSALLPATRLALRFHRTIRKCAPRRPTCPTRIPTTSKAEARRLLIWSSPGTPCPRLSTTDAISTTESTGVATFLARIGTLKWFRTGDSRPSSFPTNQLSNATESKVKVADMPLKMVVSNYVNFVARQLWLSTRSARPTSQRRKLPDTLEKTCR